MRNFPFFTVGILGPLLIRIHPCDRMLDPLRIIVGFALVGEMDGLT